MPVHSSARSGKSTAKYQKEAKERGEKPPSKQRVAQIRREEWAKKCEEAAEGVNDFSGW